MKILQNKIDFLMTVTAAHANPNGDPLDGNRPRAIANGLGEISDVCLKRKIRNRLMDMGEAVFVQSDDNKTDGYKSLKDRAAGNSELMAAEKAKKKEQYAEIACKSWIDVRSFGQVFAFKEDKAKEGQEIKGGGVSVGVRGPVSIHPAFSVDPVDIVSTQITKSVNSESNEKAKKSSDTMGMKHRIQFGLYLVKGSINVQLAERTGFTEADAEKIKEALRTIFVNDSSSARPEGSMEVHTLYWWRHNNKIGQYSSAKVHRSVQATKKPQVDFPSSIDDYEINVIPLEGLCLETYEGI